MARVAAVTVCGMSDPTFNDITELLTLSVIPIFVFPVSECFPLIESPSVTSEGDTYPENERERSSASVSRQPTILPQGGFPLFPSGNGCLP